MPDGHAELTKSMQPPELVEQLAGEAAIGESGMDGLLATDRTTELGAIERVQHRHHAGQRLDPAPTIGRTVACGEHEPAAPAP